MNLKVSSSIIAVISIIVVIGFFGLNFTENNTESVFHVTLADPTMYENGIYTNSFEIERGSYQFGFVPNGDSPQKLTISLSGTDYHIEEFVLNSKSHETGISQYYTWNYVGDEDATIQISSTQQVQITINPHENYNGPVSVFLKKQS